MSARTNAADPAGQGDRAEDAVRLYLALGRLVRSLRHGHPSPVGAGALGALSTVVRDGPLRASELAAREGVSPPSVSRMLAVLQAQGAVRRTVDPADSRASLIEATPSGRRLMSTGRSERIATLEQRMGRLSAEQRQRVCDALSALETLGEAD